MEEKIIGILVGELGYSPREAEVTCRDLMGIQDPEIRQALVVWTQTRRATRVVAGGYDTAVLSARMHYPSALLAIDMLRKDPVRTAKLLRGFR